MGSYTLKNLLSVANMTISGATLSEGVFTYPAGVFCMITQPLPVPVVGHKYYGRVDQKIPAGTTFGDGRFEYFGGDGTGKNITFASFMSATMDNEWHTYSDIQSFSYISGENWTLRSFTVSGSNTVYRQRHMIIDLTESFGAGKEPSKDWCDRCIPFFEGTKTIESKPLVGVNGVTRPIVGGYVGVNGVARKIIAGYVGVNGVAKKIWSNSDNFVFKTTIHVVNMNRIYFNISATSGTQILTIDFGDGTQQDFTNDVFHDYSAAGDYKIKIYSSTNDAIRLVGGYTKGGMAGTTDIYYGFIYFMSTDQETTQIIDDVIFRCPVLSDAQYSIGNEVEDSNFRNFNMRFEFGDEVVCPSDMVYAFPQGTGSKDTVNHTVYTDNTQVKDFALSRIDSYTIYTVKHLDGSDW